MSNTQKELNEIDNTVDALTDELLAEQQKLAEQEQTIVDAEQRAKDLEDDVDMPYEQFAEQSAEADNDIQRAKRAAASLRKRIDNKIVNLKSAINVLQDKYVVCEREVKNQRREKAEQYLKSPEWIQAQKMMWAVCALRDGYWQPTLSDMTPREPDWQERKAAAIDAGMWIDDPQHPNALERAKTLTDFGREDRH